MRGAIPRSKNRICEFLELQEPIRKGGGTERAKKEIIFLVPVRLVACSKKCNVNVLQAHSLRSLERHSYSRLESKSRLFINGFDVFSGERIFTFT